jgi:hypothetical protein
MASLTDVREALAHYAASHSLCLEISGLYDLFPERTESVHSAVASSWPARWPNGNYQGIYLFFGDLTEPNLLYVGKSSGKSSCIRARLNGYFDPVAKRGSGACVLLQEWKGYKRPWGTEPRYVLTVAMKPEDESGACLGAEQLEKHLIRAFLPPENTSLKPVSDE